MSEADEARYREAAVLQAQGMADLFTSLLPEGLMIAWDPPGPVNLYDAVPMRNLFGPDPWLRELREKQRAEAGDRRVWARDVKRRLSLVCAGEVLHRCRVGRVPPWAHDWPSWGWSCRVPWCGMGGGYASQAEAFGAAYAHASRGVRALADEILRQESGLQDGSLVDIGGILYPALQRGGAKERL